MIFVHVMYIISFGKVSGTACVPRACGVHVLYTAVHQIWLQFADCKYCYQALNYIAVLLLPQKYFEFIVGITDNDLSTELYNVAKPRVSHII